MVTRRKAFSLIELSIVIVIIGILIVGIVGSKHLIAKSRITTAQSMTRSSIIHGTLNNKLWLETSLDELAFGADLSTGDVITGWEDLSANKTAISISIAGTGPTYSNSINSVQALRFGSSSESNHLQIDNAAFLNGTNYTIFIAEKRIDTNSGVDNYLLGDSGTFGIGYESGSSIIQTHGESASDDNQANIEAVASYSNKPRILTFTHSNSEGNKIYINATLANEDTTSNATTHLSGITTLAIGKGYNGEIGEIVIFDRDLKTTERREIEDYLADKWNSPNNRDSSASCTNGTITSTGCDQSCSVSINGVSTTSVADGASGSFTCNATSAYDSGDTISYSCTDGSLSFTGNQYCNCASGYSNSSEGDVCVVDCSISETGISETSVPAGTANLTCTTGYTGTVNYTCSGGSVTINSGSCFENCDVTSKNGITETEVTSSSGSLDCDATGYDSADSVAYTCTSGTFAYTGGDQTCDCGSGYNDNGGVCEAQCTISSGDIGVESDVIVNSGDTSYDCSNSGGYTGTITHNCDNGSISTIVGTCAQELDCYGGDIVNTLPGGDIVHIFTSTGSSTFGCTVDKSVKVLVVAGGGGGGSYGHGKAGGGGGGGGLIYNGSFSVIASDPDLSVVVGAGGSRGQMGGNSEFGSLVAIGGGTASKSGGSGGGAWNSSGASNGSGTSGQGNDGGYGYLGGDNANSFAGGGGGAGARGQDADANNGGDGGDGLEYDITGTSTYYAGGGGGHNHYTVYVSDPRGTPGSGGLGGGGDAWSPGIANTGGGGGTYYAGGSGVVVVRYTPE